MTLVREKFANSRDEDVQVLPGFITGITPPEEPNEDEDLDYSDDDLGENTEITPLGDEVDEEDIENLGPDDDEDNLLSDDDDDDWDVETEQYLEENDEIDDVQSINNGPDDDDDLLLPDDDDDEEIENPDVVPEVDTDEDELFEEDEGVGADDDATTATGTPQVFDSPDAGVSSRREDRKTGRMIDHEPGTPGFNAL